MYEAPRLLSLQDRELYSPTYGCFDRNYWQWKFVDFPGSRFQEAVFSLALLYSEQFDGNPYYQKDRMRLWASAGMRFWAGLSGRDGSFNEAYPNEHSFVATAFGLLSVAEAFSILRPELDDSDVGVIYEGMVRAGDWLLSNEESHAFISNHVLGAAAALNELYAITGHDMYKSRAEYFVDAVLARQSPEGWFLEYTGADPGYLTQGIYYLARYWQKTKDAAILGALGRAVAFLAHFVHPDHTVGGEYGSRNTEFYFPAGQEILYDVIPMAAAVAEHMAEGIKKRTSAGLAAMDAYNFMPLFSNYLVSHVESSRRKTVARTLPKLPFQKEGGFVAYFEHAKLAAIKKGGYYAVLGAGKGGVIKIYSTGRGELLYSNCGYKGVLKGGRAVSTQSQDDAVVEHEAGTGLFNITGPLTGSRPRLFTPLGFVAFRLYNLTLCRFPLFARFIKRLIVNVLIFRREVLPGTYRRRVRFDRDRIAIEDEIALEGRMGIERMALMERFTAVHMGSSKYFQLSELASPVLGVEVDIRELTPNKGFRRSFVFEVDDAQ